MSRYIKSIQATGIYGRFDLYHECKPGVNILYGVNGSGKTTLLHILANVLNGDCERFAFLAFDTIEVKLIGEDLDDDVTIKLEKTIDEGKRDRITTVSINGDAIKQFSDEEVLELEARKAIGQIYSSEHPYNLNPPPLPTAYFPDFRAMIESWHAIHNQHNGIAMHEQREHDIATTYARASFGQFVPVVTYPSPVEVEDRLNDEIQNAIFNVAHTYRTILSQALQDVYTTLSSQSNGQEQEQQPEAILEDIKVLSEKLQRFQPFLQQEPEITQFLSSVPLDNIREGAKPFATPILNVYRKWLDEAVRIQEEAFQEINRYLETVNTFLRRSKKVKVERNSARITFLDGHPVDFRSLSSGERHIITLMYAATRMSDKEVVLIDEPEMSLHIDRQRSLLKAMSKHAPGKQIIACTHSPVIGADYDDDRMVELAFKPAHSITPTKMDEYEEEEILF